ncbi:MAG TPA: 3'(2'),5'-bisphosphate nucleotidase CysQ [Polyangiaceae bacterium]|jgi:3'(2'), 5'-bisphosphate nucleotidase
MSAELDELVRIAEAAAVIVRRHYATEFRVEYKIGDDPVTAADKEANAFIITELERAFPGVPIVAEESDPGTFDVRRDARECFFVDPLDGTREFVARNGEFAVMIGLARERRAALGVVNAPEWHRAWAGDASSVGSAFEIARDGSRRAIHTTDVEDVATARCLVSRSRATDETFAMLAKLGATNVRKIGSAGLKAVAVACGEADAWLQPSAGGKLWDTCGPEAIARAAGGVFSEIDYAAGPLELPRILVASTQKLYARLAGLER